MAFGGFFADVKMAAGQRQIVFGDDVEHLLYLVPHLLGNTTGLYWDGLTAVDQTGKFWNGLSSSMQIELINMIIAGRYGETVKEAFVDQTTYWKIRDQLIEWPNHENIDRDGLCVVSVQFVDWENAESPASATS